MERHPDALVELATGALLLLDGALNRAAVSCSGPDVAELLENADPANFDFNLWQKLALRVHPSIEPPEPLEVHIDGYPLGMALAHCLGAVQSTSLPKRSDKPKAVVTPRSLSTSWLLFPSSQEPGEAVGRGSTT